MSVRHTKIHGVVERIEHPRWWARLCINDEDYITEMADELPDHAEEGSLFTIHKPKRGRTYLYWIQTRLSKNQIKRAERDAMKLYQQLKWE